MDLTPRTHIIRSMQNQGLTWWKVLAELIDNSLDAGANQVKVSFKNKKLIVVDDGKGIKNIASAVTLGYHDSHSSNGIGTYGIGLKDAWLFCGPTIEIDTVRNNRRTTLKIDINDVLDNNWQSADPTYEDTDDEDGTTIKIALTRNLPKKTVIERLRWLYTPALSRGKQVLYDTGGRTCKPLEPVHIPLVEQVVCDTFEVLGRKATINIGILPEGKKMQYGPFWVIYGMRVIDATSLGAGKFSTLRMGGTIELGMGWVLNKNKDDLANYKEELGNAIHERIVHVLEKAEQLSEDVESDALKSEVADMLNVSIKHAKKEARTKGNGDSSGTVPARHTGRRRRRAARTKNEKGSVTQHGYRNGKFTIDWEDVEDEDHIGKYDNTDNRVKLNINHAFVKRAKDNGNTIAIYSVAVALMSEYFTTHKEDGAALLFRIEDFGVTYGSIIKGIKEVKSDEEAAS